VSTSLYGWHLPIVAGTVQPRVPGEDCWSIEIDCPYCPAKHRHGGGDGPQPDISGDRVPHCQDQHYRQRKVFDRRVIDHLPNYEIAPADAAIDWDTERAYAAALLEEAEMAVEAADSADVWASTAQGRILNQQLREFVELAAQSATQPANDRNARLLAAWQSRRGGAK
jgi:hypothetical protein